MATPLRERKIDTLGVLALLALELWAVIAGLPRLGSLLYAPGRPEFEIHPYVAVLGLALAGFLTVRQGKRLLRPTQRDLSVPETQTQIILRQLAKNRNAVAGGYLVMVLLLGAVLTPLLAPFNPDQIDVGPKLAEPSWTYLMGTDDFGRDLFSRVLFGARISMSIGFIAVTIAGSIGTFIGATTGFFGGWYDKGLMWFTSMLMSLPRLVLLLAVVGFFRTSGAQSIFLIVGILGLTGWMGVARIVRSQVLSLREQDFVAAARALGLPELRIIRRHIVPNTMAPVIVYGTLAIGGTMLAEASLSFLGLGVPPPTATWGSLVNDSRDYLRTAWWLAVFPGLMIAVAVMSFNLLGDGLRDALDPRLRGRE